MKADEVISRVVDLCREYDAKKSDFNMDRGQKEQPGNAVT